MMDRKSGIKLGCSTWMMPGETFGEKIAAAKGYGFDGVEVRLFEEEATPAAVREIVDALDAEGMGAANLIMPGETYRRPLLDRGILDAKIKLSEKAIDAAAQLGCPTIVCPEYGYQNPLPLFDHPRRPSVEVHSLLIEFLRHVSDYAGRAGTKVMIEPINRYETRFFYTLDDGKAVIDEVGSPNLMLLADLFHMNIEETDIEDAILSHKGDIRHVHLGDSNRLLPGMGHTDFATVFKALTVIGYDGYTALECSTAGDPDVVFPRCVEYLNSVLCK